jgi:hypothetical protein
VTPTTVADEIIPGGKLALATNFSGSEVRILFTSEGDAKMSGTYFTSYEAANAYIVEVTPVSLVGQLAK